MAYHNTIGFTCCHPDAGQENASRSLYRHPFFPYYWWGVFCVMLLLITLPVGFKSVYSLSVNVLSCLDYVPVSAIARGVSALVFRQSAIVLLLISCTAIQIHYSLPVWHIRQPSFFVARPGWVRRGFRRLHLDTEPISPA